jgi:hypothetical protein
MRTSALLPYLARLQSVQPAHDHYSFALEDGGRLAPMPADSVAFRSFRGMGEADSRSLRYDNYARMQHFVRRFTYVPSRRFLGDVRREFMPRPSNAPHGTLGSYLRDALHEGSVDTVAWLHVPRG